jgi:ATP-dependent DNA helicase RecG
MQVTIKMREGFDLDHFATKTSSEQVSEHDDKIQSLLEYCIMPRKRDEMQKHYGIASREYFRKNVLEPLLQSGQLKMTIPDKPKSGNQRYVKA